MSSLGEIDVEVGAAGAGGVVGIVEVAGDAVRPVDFVVGHRQRLEQHAAERHVVGDDVVELHDVAHDGVEKGLHLLQQQFVGAAGFLGEDGAGASEHERAEDDRYDENEQERKQIGVEQTALMTCPSHTRSNPPGVQRRNVARIGRACRAAVAAGGRSARAPRAPGAAQCCIRCSRCPVARTAPSASAPRLPHRPAPPRDAGNGGWYHPVPMRRNAMRRSDRGWV